MGPTEEQIAYLRQHGRLTTVDSGKDNHEKISEENSRYPSMSTSTIEQTTEDFLKKLSGSGN